MKNKDKLLNSILPVLTVIAIIILWSVFASTIDNAFILPSASAVMESFGALLTSREFYIALFSTFLRSLIAFIISFVLGFVLAVLSVKSSVIKSALSPVIKIMRALPTIAVVLLLLLWTTSNIAPVVVTMLVVLPTVYTQVISAFNSLDKTVSEAARVDGANEKAVFLKVELPQAMPTVYSVIGSGISLNFKLMVAAEVLSQTAKSIGYMLNTSKVYFETAQMFALVIASVLIGVIIESVFEVISKKSSSFK